MSTVQNHGHHGRRQTSACPAVSAIDLFSRTFVAARPGGFGSGTQRYRARGNQQKKECLLRRAWNNRRYGVLSHMLFNPAWGLRALRHWQAIPA